VVSATAAVLRYVVHGLKEAKKVFGDKPEAQQVMSYLQTIEDFKHCDDEHHAARLIEMHSLLLEHIPGHFLKSKEVQEVRHT
jgi:60 kDa SS-A/Ro ribonucleoprotein